MLDQPGPFSEVRGGPIMAQSSTQNDPSWPKMALHDPKCPCMTQNGPKTLLMGILDDIMSCHVTLGLFRGPRGPIMAQNSTQNGPLWPKMALHDPKWCFNEEPSWPKMSHHDPKCTCMTPNGPKTFLRGIIHNYMTYWTTLGPFQRPTWPQKNQQIPTILMENSKSFCNGFSYVILCQSLVYSVMLWVPLLCKVHVMFGIS